MVIGLEKNESFFDTFELKEPKVLLVNLNK
jgi:hypothetical protein